MSEGRVLWWRCRLRANASCTNSTYDSRAANLWCAGIIRQAVPPGFHEPFHAAGVWGTARSHVGKESVSGPSGLDRLSGCSARCSRCRSVPVSPEDRRRLLVRGDRLLKPSLTSRSAAGRDCPALCPRRAGRRSPERSRGLLVRGDRLLKPPHFRSALPRLSSAMPSPAGPRLLVDLGRVLVRGDRLLKPPPSRSARPRLSSAMASPGRSPVCREIPPRPGAR